MQTGKQQTIIMACVLSASMLVATFDAPAQLLETFTPLVPERITASASSWQIDLESHNTPQRAIDGAGEAYCYWETREPTEQWLLLDLGDSYRIGGLEIESNARRINGYKIHVSNDPEDPGSG